MSDGWPKKPGRKKMPRIKPNEVRGAKCLRNILELLKGLRSHEDCPNRLLHDDEYAAYLLLYFFTPVLTSMRGIQQVSEFVLRLHGNAVYQVLEERPLTPAAQRAGVRRDLIIRLGGPETPDLHDHALRLVEVHIPAPAPRPGLHRKGRPDRKTKLVRTQGGEETLLLLTDLLDLEADLVAEICRSRWQIEIFFRWFKKVLHAEHLLSHSENGVTLVAYCALIALLLLTLWTGRKPTQRTYGLFCFFQLGWLDEDELVAHLEKLEPAEV
jgi:IS4 transposase